MKTDIKTFISDFGIKAKFFGKKYKPEILLGVTILTGVAGLIEVAKASTNVNDIVEETSEAMNAVRKAGTDGYILDDKGTMVEYTDRDKTLDTTKVILRTGVKLTKLYSKAIILEGVSLTCLIAMYSEQKAHVAALASALSGMEKAFDSYRWRVREKYGEEEEEKLYYGVKARTVEKKVIDADGKEHTEEVEEEYIDSYTNYQVYSKFFDESCADPLGGSDGWTKDPDHNLWWLESRLSILNQRLKTQGYLFLNDVYKELNMKPTKAGAIAGWVYDYKADQPSESEVTVDFGLANVNNPGTRAFVNGFSPSVLIDFNYNHKLRSNILDDVYDE